MNGSCVIAENRRNTIHREDHICQLNCDQRNEKDCNVALAILDNEEIVTVLLLCNWENLSRDAYREVRLGIELLFLLDLHTPCAPNEDTTEDEEDPIEPTHELGTKPDKEATHDDRANNTPEQDPVLIDARDAETCEDHQEDEQVVHAQ